MGDHYTVAINAQILPNSGMGGGESVLIGLVKALGQLDDGSEEYLIIGPRQRPDWWKAYTGPNQRIVPGPQPRQQRSTNSLQRLKRTLGPLRPFIRAIWRKLFLLPSRRTWPEVPISNGFYEGLGCDVIHFLLPSFVLCALPMIYNPHDLQHRHYPQFFTASHIAWREVIYPAGCNLAHTIAVASQWTKQDIVRHYRVDPDKVQVIPWAPPTQTYPSPSPETSITVQKKYQLQIPFALYPANTIEHKNHLRLLKALAMLRDRE